MSGSSQVYLDQRVGLIDATLSIFVRLSAARSPSLGTDEVNLLRKPPAKLPVIPPAVALALTRSLGGDEGSINHALHTPLRMTVDGVSLRKFV